MLSKLGVLARAAEYIDLGDEKESEFELTWRGVRRTGRMLHIAEKAGEETKSATKKKFGHLHVLFRDFSFEGTREVLSCCLCCIPSHCCRCVRVTQSVYEQLFTKEKVQKSLKPGPGVRSFLSCATWAC